jgi:steroid delta-isomerase-like uncharacterized protein
MSTDETQNKGIARRFFAASDANDESALNELLAPDLIAHVPAVTGPVNREMLLQVGRMFAAAFSDTHYTIEDQIAEVDKVATRVTWRAVHTGEFQGLPATGKQIVGPGMMIMHIKDGKIAEYWANYDQMGMMRQLGLIPPPQPAR